MCTGHILILDRKAVETRTFQTDPEATSGIKVHTGWASFMGHRKRERTFVVELMLVGGHLMRTCYESWAFYTSDSVRSRVDGQLFGS